MENQYKVPKEYLHNSGLRLDKYLTNHRCYNRVKLLNSLEATFTEPKPQTPKLGTRHRKRYAVPNRFPLYYLYTNKIPRKIEFRSPQRLTYAQTVGQGVPETNFEMIINARRGITPLSFN